MVKPRTKHPHRTAQKEPLERIANALERIADAQETRAMSQSRANKFLEQFLPSMISVIGSNFSFPHPELRGSGEIQIPQPPKSR